MTGKSWEEIREAGSAKYLEMGIELGSPREQQQQERRMCPAQDSSKGGAQQPASSSADSGYRNPGLRGVRTTSLFRAVNPELFIKPANAASRHSVYQRHERRVFKENKPVMVVGLLSLTLCVGYLGYLHAIKENDQQLYEAVDSEGEKYMRRKSSKWD
ncbi:Small integral membrane protein 8 [Labeo rohita]|uniref:Small integral membrane protein 8 n=1 Tax=Labeo rohita TaxID=84645 RepID=A0ABQ8LP37_LABRO|nr:Small integral membrane protein 8 [Labeo rohita]